MKRKLWKQPWALTVAAAVVLAAVTTCIIYGDFWSYHKELRAKVERRKRDAAQWLERRGEIKSRLAELVATLPMRPQWAPLEDFLTPKLASLTGVTASRDRRNYGATETVGEGDSGFCRTPISCQWNGTPEQLEQFFSQLDTLGAAFDLDKLTVDFGADGEKLSGSCTVNCSYRLGPKT